MATKENKIRFFLVNTTNREAIISWLNLGVKSTNQSAITLPYVAIYTAGTVINITTNNGVTSLTLISDSTISDLQDLLNTLGLDGAFILNTDGTNNYLYLNSDTVTISQIEITSGSTPIPVGTIDVVDLVNPAHFNMLMTTGGDSITVDWGDGNSTTLSGSLLAFNHIYSSLGLFNVTITGSLSSIISINCYDNTNGLIYNPFVDIGFFNLDDYSKPIRLIIFRNNSIISFENLISQIYTKSIAGYGYSGAKTLTINGGSNASPSGTYQAPLGYIQANATTTGNDGTPSSSKEKIYVLVNQNIDNTTTKKYNWNITYN